MTPERLKSIRAATGLSQSKFAAGLELTRGHLSKMETGAHPIPKTTGMAAILLLLMHHPDMNRIMNESWALADSKTETIQ